MKISKQLIISLLILIVLAGLYRVMPNRPYGFSPFIAMAIFAGAVIKEKRFAFLLPIVAMLFSDLLYQLLFIFDISPIPGFYEGQITNYILFGGLTAFGFFIKGFDLKKISIASVSAPTAYFFLSNALVWASTSPMAGLGRPKTFPGLLMTLTDGLPFYPWTLVSTILFSAILFGTYYFLFEKNFSLVRA